MPCKESDRLEYFQDLFGIWFPEGKTHPDFNIDENKKTFHKGGFYRHDFKNSSLSLIAMNTIYFTSENECMRALS